MRGASQDAHSSMGTVVPNPAWRLVWALASLKDMEEDIHIEGFYDMVSPPTLFKRHFAGYVLLQLVIWSRDL